MKKANIIATMGRKFNRIGFKISKKSPELFVAAGVLGVVVSAVMACHETLKAREILDGANKNIDDIHKCASDPAYKNEYSEEDEKKDLTTTYVQTGVKLAVNYAPSVILGTLSIAAILKSHSILSKRNTALAAAYAAAEKSFKEYRNRVSERFGKEIEKELKYNLKMKEIEERTVDENGKEQVVKKVVSEVGPGVPSEYSVIFNKFNPYWEDDTQYALMFLKAQQEFMNDILRTKGVLTLNTVREALGFEPTKPGMVVGWIYDEKNPVGDNCVDFGLREVYSDDEQAILLDFNVDGNIYNRL